MKKTLSIPRPIVLTGEEMMDEASRVIRAEKEKKRGIARDREGKIIRDKKLGENQRIISPTILEPDMLSGLIFWTVLKNFSEPSHSTRI